MNVLDRARPRREAQGHREGRTRGGVSSVNERPRPMRRETNVSIDLKKEAFSAETLKAPSSSFCGERGEPRFADETSRMSVDTSRRHPTPVLYGSALADATKFPGKAVTVCPAVSRAPKGANGIRISMRIADPTTLRMRGFSCVERGSPQAVGVTHERLYIRRGHGPTR